MPNQSTGERPRPNFIVSTELHLFEPRPELILFQIRSRELRPTSPPQWYTSVEDELDLQEYFSLFVLKVEQVEALARTLLAVAAESRNSS